MTIKNMQRMALSNTCHALHIFYIVKIYGCDKGMLFSSHISYLPPYHAIPSSRHPNFLRLSLSAALVV